MDSVTDHALYARIELVGDVTYLRSVRRLSLFLELAL